MTIGTQAYLQGYMHEKTAGDGLPWELPYEGGPSVLQAETRSPASWERDIMRAPLASATPRHLDRPGNSFSESANSPITNEDLYRRYGRLPASYLHNQRGLPFPEWSAQQDKNKEIRRGVKDRITAENRAATTGRLQASGRNKGRIGLGDVLRRTADESWYPLRDMGNPFRMGMTALNEESGHYLAGAAGSPPRTLKERVNAIMNTSRDPRRGYAGTKWDEALSEKMKKRHGAPISYEAEAVRRRDTER